MCTGVAVPGGWVTSDSPNPPPVSSPDASRSNSDPSTHVPGLSPGPRTSAEAAPSASLTGLPASLTFIVFPLSKFIRIIIGSIKSNLCGMSEPVKPRSSGSVKPRTYRSSVREEQARRTRLAILDAARLLFTEQGYAATTIAQIAAGAGVAVDTVYAAVGTKPVLARLLLETSISGTDQAVPAEQRDYVQRVRAAATASEKIRLYATAVTEVNSRLAPLHLVLRDAAAQAPELGELWT